MVNIKPWSEAVDGEYTIRTCTQFLEENKTAECQQIEFWQCQQSIFLVSSVLAELTCKKLI